MMVWGCCRQPRVYAPHPRTLSLADVVSDVCSAAPRATLLSLVGRRTGYPASKSSPNVVVAGRGACQRTCTRACDRSRLGHGPTAAVDQAAERPAERRRDGRRALEAAAGGVDVASC